jgi:hypothetical protein
LTAGHQLAISNHRLVPAERQFRGDLWDESGE